MVVFASMYDSALQFVDFIDPTGKPVSGLVPVRKPNLAILHVDEKAALFDAATFNDIDYIFFRRFSDGRSSQITAYIVDNSDERLNEEALSKLHHQVWLHGVAPLLYVAWPSRIDVLSCARQPDFWKNKDEELQYNPAERLAVEAFKTAGKINKELSRFSAFRLADGTFWDEPANHSLTNHAKAAHQSLIQAIVEADEALDGENKPVLRRLLLLMVLIKYLEDRRVFPNDGWFGRFRSGSKSFFDVLRGGEPEEVYKLLDFLERKFNGDIFNLDRNALTKPILEEFAHLVEARTLKRQRYLWKQYTFEHLPVEVISHLYQRFVQGGHGAVYTPPFLATLLLDHAMPYEKLSGKERVLDPACGSGIFLVGAFRRLINVWRYKNNWQRPTVKTLKDILKRSIFGTELDSNAVDLTAFSLSLAVCDALQPDVIWKELHFERLRETNLFEVDFFRELIDSRQDKASILKEGFDVVIGNPPFESKLSSAGMEVNKDEQKQDKSRRALPDKQVAYLFLEQAFTILRRGGTLCLIQPCGILYNRNTTSFCNSIFRRYSVELIFDFASIRKLYEADPKTVAILAKAVEPMEDSLIKHWTFRRTTSVHERICFELDHYDRHQVSQRHAEKDAHVWRVNLLGGGRLNDISQRLRSMRTLEAFIDSQEGWDYGEGFILGNKANHTPFLKNKPILPTGAFSEAGIDEDKISILDESYFDSPRQEIRYTSPLVLIKELASLPITFWDKGFLAYRARIVGIHAPPSQKKELRKFHEHFINNHSLYRFHCALHGSEFLVGWATSIRKQDIDILPVPEDFNDLSLSFWEDSLLKDVLNYLAEYVRLGQNSKLLETSADIEKMRAYSDMFIRMLGSVYENLHAAEPVFLNGLICQPFYFGERPNLKWVAEQNEEELQRLIHDDNSYASLRTIRILRYYSENVLLLVKPDRLRYWIPSTAIRDADETLIDLRQQGH